MKTRVSLKYFVNDCRLSDGIDRCCISEHGTFSLDSIKNKLITTMKGGFYFTKGYNKQVK